MSSLFSRLGGARMVGNIGARGDAGQPDTASSATGDLPRPLDTKAFSKLYKRMDRVVKSLQNSRMNLSRSPPCLIDTLPDIYVKLKEINSFYELPDKKQILDRNDFFYITVNNIFDKCKRVNQLFKDHREDIYSETSDSRKQLINLTIVIAYIFHDLKALFPEAHFSPNFRIAKEEAERWWKENFPDKIIVSWTIFREQCSHSFPPLSKLELSNLKSTIDLTCNDHVSIFEFDVFTRLFAPWPMLMKNFKKLTFHPGYMASATFENVKALLTRHKEKPGSYVFRMSCTKLGFWSIGYVTDHSEQRRDAISQIVVRDGKPIVEALVEGYQKGFYLYPNGEPSNPDLSELLHVRPRPQFQVTKDQFEEYSMIGSTFQECKICNLRDKDTQLDLCGHFMCSKCLSQWLSKGMGCPFCRCEIRSTQSIVMQPFKPPSNPPSQSDMPPPQHPPPPLPAGFESSPIAAPRLRANTCSPPRMDSGTVPRARRTSEDVGSADALIPSPTSSGRKMSVGPASRNAPLPPPPPPCRDGAVATSPGDEPAAAGSRMERAWNGSATSPDSQDGRGSSGGAPRSVGPYSPAPGGTYVNLPVRDVPLPPRPLPGEPAASSLPAVKPTSLPLANSPEQVTASSLAGAVIAEFTRSLAGPDCRPQLLLKPRRINARRLGVPTDPRQPVPGFQGGSSPVSAVSGPMSPEVDAVFEPSPAPDRSDVRSELRELPPPPPPPLPASSPGGAEAGRGRPGRQPPALKLESNVRPEAAPRTNVLDPDLAVLPPPPPPPITHIPSIPESQFHTSNVEESAYNTPRVEESAYNIPRVEESAYNIPRVEESAYNTPRMEDSDYHVPQAEDSVYNVPGGLAEDPYHVPMGDGYMVPPGAEEDAVLDRVSASVSNALRESSNDVQRMLRSLEGSKNK